MNAVLTSLRASRDVFLLADRQASADMCSDFIQGCFVVGPDFYRHWAQQLADRANQFSREQECLVSTPVAPSIQRDAA